MDLDPKELRQYIISLGIVPFRSNQILTWIYKKGVLEFEKMTDIPSDLREKLGAKTSARPLHMKEKIRSSDRSTCKYLFVTDDGHSIETVKIKEKDRTTICVSSQAGCPLKCSFCATGRYGYKRDLTAAEMIYQVLYFAAEEKEEVSNVVFMGMGEPLLNYRNVLKAIKILNSKDAMNFGIRRMTVSTCGLPEEIRKLAREGLEINLSVSLNSANNGTRSKMMPVNRKFPLDELMKAVRYYVQTSGRRVTFEYVMIKGLNDSIKDAKELLELLKGTLSHVNLIPFNRVKGIPYEGSTKERMDLFRQILAAKGVNVTIRRSKGSDIAAACGQLAGVLAPRDERKRGVEVPV